MSPSASKRLVHFIPLFIDVYDDSFIANIISANMAPKFSTSKVRNAEEIAKPEPQFSREIREKADTKEKLMICKEATIGSKAKLSSVNFQKEMKRSPSDSVLENNVEVETFIENLERHTIRFDINYFMSNFPILEAPDKAEHDCFRKGKTLDLFSNWDMIGKNKGTFLSTIGKTIAWLKTYTEKDSASYLEDMEWLHLHLMNSMEADLRDEVTSTLKHDYPADQHGGPLTFAVMIDKVINLSPSAISTMKRTLREFKISSVPGEDINIVVRRFLYALKRLESNNSVDAELINDLYKVFQTSSVKDFNDQVELMERMSRGSRGVTRSYKEILDEVKEHYSDIQARNLWVGVTPLDQGESSFVANDGNSNPAPSESPYSAPCDADKVSSSPLRYERVIHGKKMKYCGNCTRNRGSKKLGRWNTTHFTDEHTGRKPDADSKDTTATKSTTKKQVSFADALLGAQDDDADDKSI